jgi:hypothetical protein
MQAPVQLFLEAFFQIFIDLIGARIKDAINTKIQFGAIDLEYFLSLVTSSLNLLIFVPILKYLKFCRYSSAWV